MNSVSIGALAVNLSENNTLALVDHWLIYIREINLKLSIVHSYKMHANVWVIDLPE